MFADSTTDFILVIYNDSSLLIGVMTIALRKKRYDEAVVICVKLGLDMPALPKQRKKTACLGDFYISTDSTNEHTWQTPKQYHQHHFSESSICWLQRPKVGLSKIFWSISHQNKTLFSSLLTANLQRLGEPTDR